MLSISYFVVLTEAQRTHASGESRQNLPDVCFDWFWKAWSVICYDLIPTFILIIIIIIFVFETKFISFGKPSSGRRAGLLPLRSGSFSSFESRWRCCEGMENDLQSKNLKEWMIVNRKMKLKPTDCIVRLLIISNDKIWVLNYFCLEYHSLNFMIIDSLPWAGDCWKPWEKFRLGPIGFADISGGVTVAAINGLTKGNIL